MAAPRLPFLWPMLFRASEQTAPLARNVGRRRALHATTQKRQAGSITKRYGQANEPPPYLGGGKGYGPPTRQPDAQGAKALPKIGESLQKDGEREADDEDAQPSTVDAQLVQGKRKEAATGTATEAETEAETPQSTKQPPTGDPMLDAADPDTAPEKSADSLLDTVMDPDVHEKEGHTVPPPSAPEPSTSMAWINPNLAPEEHTPSLRHPPHIDKPRYIHHFDTYGLVRRLEAGDWTKPQAITLMKSMRLLLGDNLDNASRALVSRSDVENESYLFSAACSELRTEVFARRVALHEKMRMERDQLQHEVDILEQRLGQDTAGMKDELRGMFDDRKMAVRNEQRYMESKVQELNYKITVNLQADSKSDVEGVRWVLTRRVILTLGIIVMMVVSSLKLYSNSVQQKEQEKRRRQKMKHAASQTEERGSGSGSGRGGDVNGGSNGTMMVSEGDNPAFVSLG